MRLNRYLVASTIAVLLAAAIWAANATDGARPARAPEPAAAPGASPGLLSYLAVAGAVPTPAAAPSSSATPMADAALRQLAAGLPADFQADILLRLAAAPGATDAPELILRAYRLAPQAARPLPGVAARAWAAGGDAVLPSRTAGLDQLSLQIRAVRAMLAAAPKRISALSSPFPGPRAVGCDADYVDDPDAVYELASATLPAASDARLAFALKVIGRARTEMDLVPAITFVSALPPLAQADELLVARGLGALFARAQGNDPGFAATSLALASRMEPLLARYDNVPAARRELQGAFRSYVSVHLAAARCPASLTGDYQQFERRIAAKEGIPAPPSIVSEAPAGMARDAYTDEVRALRNAGASTLERQRAATQGDAAVAAPAPAPAGDLVATVGGSGMLAAIAADSSGRLRRIALYELRRYMEYAPPGPERDNAVGQLERLLADGGAMRDHDRRFGELRALADAARRWPDGDQRLRQLAASRDPVLQAYARLMLGKQFP